MNLRTYVCQKHYQAQFIPNKLLNKELVANSHCNEKSQIKTTILKIVYIINFEILYVLNINSLLRNSKRTLCIVVARAAPKYTVNSIKIFVNMSVINTFVVESASLIDLFITYVSMCFRKQYDCFRLCYHEGYVFTQDEISPGRYLNLEGFHLKCYRLKYDSIWNVI